MPPMLPPEMPVIDGEMIEKVVKSKIAGKIAGFREGVRIKGRDYAETLGRVGYKQERLRGAAATARDERLIRRGYRRMGYIGGGVSAIGVGGGVYMNRRSSGVDGTEAKSSGSRGY